MAISLHALREESDPVGLGVLLGLGISIHALREESDASPDAPRRHASFQSTLSVRRATE